MGRYCFVDGCKSTKYQGQDKQIEESVSFHGFPNDPGLREKWKQAIYKGNDQLSALQPPKYSRICIKHFSDSCIEQFGLASKRLKPNCIPSIFPHGSKESNEPETNTDCETSEKAGSSTSNTEFGSLVPKSNNEMQVKDETQDAEIECAQYEGMPETPKKNVLLKGQVRYPGDVTKERLNDMTPRTLMKSIRLLKDACARKNLIIKRLRTQQSRQKKKIHSLSQLLADLKKDCLISSDATNVIEVQLKSLIGKNSGVS